MKRTTWVAGVSATASGLLGLVWLGFYFAQPALGYQDTDDPALGVQFVRDHPDVFVNGGIGLILMAIALTITVVSVAEVVGQRADGWALRASSAFGLFAALSLLVFGVLRIGASGPLLHIAGLDQEWGETAYLVVQMAGVQGVLPAGLLALALWAVGLSLIGARSRAIPLAVCLLGVVPAVHVVGRLVGERGFLPDASWFLVVASIPGTLVWCLALGVGLLVRAARIDQEPSQHRPPAPG